MLCGPHSEVRSSLVSQQPHASLVEARIDGVVEQEVSPHSDPLAASIVVVIPRLDNSIRHAIFGIHAVGDKLYYSGAYEDQTQPTAHAGHDIVSETNQDSTAYVLQNYYCGGAYPSRAPCKLRVVRVTPDKSSGTTQSRPK